MITGMADEHAPVVTRYPPHIHPISTRSHDARHERLSRSFFPAHEQPRRRAGTRSRDRSPAQPARPQPAPSSARARYLLWSGLQRLCLARILRSPDLLARSGPGTRALRAVDPRGSPCERMAPITWPRSSGARSPAGIWPPAGVDPHLPQLLSEWAPAPASPAPPV